MRNAWLENKMSTNLCQNRVVIQRKNLYLYLHMRYYKQSAALCYTSKYAMLNDVSKYDDSLNVCDNGRACVTRECNVH